MPKRPRPLVLPTADDARLDEPLYAINLLDRARPWAYDLYGTLAFPAARRVGARPMLKGVEGECWLGDPSRARETLLVVCYRHADAFLDLASNPYFAVISMLRKLGVSDFQFGLSRRLDEGTKPPKRPRRRKGELLALLWPEAGDGDEADGAVGAVGAGSPDLTDLKRRVSAAGSRIVFVGSKKAILALDRGEQRGVGPTRLAPPLPWTSLAVVAGTEHTLRPLVESAPPGVELAVHYRQIF